MSNLPLVRFLISAAAHTDSVWYGSLVFVHVRPLELLLRERGTAGDERGRRDEREGQFREQTHDASLICACAVARVDVSAYRSAPTTTTWTLVLLFLSGRRCERRHGVLQRILARQQRPHVDAARRQIVDRPVELDAPAERAAQVELLRHQLVDDERQRLVRQRADLHDDAAALGRGDARLERGEVARDFVGRRRTAASRARRRRGRRAASRRRRRSRACASGRSSTSETVILRAPASRAAITVTQPIVPAPVISTDLPSEIAAALDRVQADRERLGERELAERDVAAHRIALPLAHHEVLLEHALHVREAGSRCRGSACSQQSCSRPSRQ